MSRKKQKSNLLKKISATLMRRIGLRSNKKNKTASRESNQSSHTLPIQSGRSSKTKISKLPLMKTEIKSRQDQLPNNNMGMRFSPQPQPFPPEVAKQIDSVVSKMMDKCKPELEELTKILYSYGHDSGSIEFGVGRIPSPIQEIFGLPVMPDPSITNRVFKFIPPLHTHPMPPQNEPVGDLLDGIIQVLNAHFGVNQTDILGMILDKNRNVAHDIAKILEAARKRDQRSLARELETIIKKLQ